MKDKIIMLVLGILIGAVITAGCFLLFAKNGKNMEEQDGMRGQRPQMGNFVPGDMPQGGPNGGDGQSIEDTNTANS